MNFAERLCNLAGNCISMESILWIILGIVWLIISGINKNKTERDKQRRKQQQSPSSETKTTKPETLKDIFDEMRRQVETHFPENKETAPPPVLSVPKKQGEKRRITNKQVVVTDAEQITIAEKKAALEYTKFVAEQRKKEHDAEHSHLEKKAILLEENEVYEPFVIDLQHIVIADAIINRPHY